MVDMVNLRLRIDKLMHLGCRQCTQRYSIVIVNNKLEIARQSNTE